MVENVNPEIEYLIGYEFNDNWQGNSSFPKGCKLKHQPTPPHARRAWEISLQIVWNVGGVKERNPVIFEAIFH